ncbi:MAG: flagellar protein FlaG [Gammaproteobacteria bacterium]|nr:flagellar protein FlaG [Gammaproteobacteria bacterium]MCZ6773683.1 flagellar protein FlaG [Pseudomonadota bacterium]
MDIRTHTAPAPIPSVSIAKPGEERDNVQAHRRVATTADVKADNKVREHHKRDDEAREVRKERKPPEVRRLRLELRIDDETKQVFGRIVDQDTGEEIRQIPTESIRHLQAITRELFGDLVNETVDKTVDETV